MATPDRDGLDGHNGQRSIFRDASAQQLELQPFQTMAVHEVEEMVGHQEIFSP